MVVDLTLIPSRSPAVIHEKGEEEEEEEGDLETRLKRKMGKPVTAPAQPKRSVIHLAGTSFIFLFLQYYLSLRVKYRKSFDVGKY